MAVICLTLYPSPLPATAVICLTVTLTRTLTLTLRRKRSSLIIAHRLSTVQVSERVTCWGGVCARGGAVCVRGAGVWGVLRLNPKP